MGDTIVGTSYNELRRSDKSYNGGGSAQSIDRKVYTGSGGGATHIATNNGDNIIWTFSFLFKISISEKPIAAHKKPFNVCNIVSQCLNIP